jgi:hypothetical protein
MLFGFVLACLDESKPKFSDVFKKFVPVLRKDYGLILCLMAFFLVSLRMKKLPSFSSSTQRNKLAIIDHMPPSFGQSWALIHMFLAIELLLFAFARVQD